MASTESVILKLFRIPTMRIPGPFVAAGAMIWLAGYLLKEWDPERYPDYKSIFATLPWMSVLVGFIGFALLGYFIFQLVVPIRIWLLRRNVAAKMRKHNLPQGMVLVPGGVFRFHFSDEKREIPGFFIDRYPVTNADYQKFIEKSGYHAPPSWTEGRCPAGKERHPVTMINVDDANAYTEWRSNEEGRKFRLPSEEEWEKAARGPFGLKYPWGNRFDSELCNAGKGSKGDTASVNHFYRGRSPYECFDMCGNVWEWTGSWYDPDEKIIVIRGGSFYFDKEFAATFIRYHDKMTDRWPDLGFRCACELS